MSLDNVLAHIDAHWDEHLAATRDLLRRPSISADGTGMPEMAALLAEWIRELGGTAEVVETPLHPVVVGEVDAGQPHTLLLYGMYDVQPVLGEEWISDPFGAVIVDLPGLGPSVINRGAANQKGPLGSLFNVLRSIKAATGGFPVNLRFLIEGEEEMGSRNLPGVVERYKERLAADACFFAHLSENSDGTLTLPLGFKGMLFFELACRGGDWGGPTTRDIHGYASVWIHNPAWRLIHALASMFSPDQTRITIDGFYDEVAPPSPHDEALLADLAPSFDPSDELTRHEVRRFKYDLSGVDLLRKYLYQPTLNINGIVSGHMAGGTKTIIPHEARAKVDVRLAPNMDPQRTLARIREHLDTHGFEDIEIRLENSYGWSKTTIDDTPVRAMLRTYREMGYEPEIVPHLAGSAPFYLFTDVLKTPPVLGGLGHGGRQHSPNEYATVAGLRRHEESIARFIYNWADEVSREG